ncbi:response regulator transcription factor [Phenylobacterium sp. LjRoot219]|uniref:response regulator transcription factor n=1 Tax=Phenylobacterium sp. LjRoot219 TaxID=3342283 RepID=UPI003ECEA8E5
MFRILVADDQPIVRLAVRNLLEDRGFLVCGEAADGEAALALAMAEAPDVALLDVMMPRLSGIGVAHCLREQRADVKVLLYSMWEDEGTVLSAVAAGVRGYLLKNEGAEELERAVLRVAGNRTYFSPSISETLECVTSGRRISRFTTRELQIAQMLADGCKNNEIARRMNVSIKTVESHRTSAMQKGNCHTAADLVRYAFKHRLI